MDELERLATDIVEDHAGARIQIVPAAGGITYSEFLRLRDLVAARDATIELSYSTHLELIRK